VPILVHDVTAEVQARQRIEELAARARQQAEELDAIFDAMVEGVVFYDENERPAKANRAARMAYGNALEAVSRDKVIQMLNLRHLDGRQVTVKESPVDRALRGEVIQNEWFRFTNSVGEELIMAATAAPLYLDCRRSGAVVVWHDVTERVKAETVLRESEEKLKALFEILPVGISVLDSKRQIQSTNPALTAILDMPVNGLQQGRYQKRTYLRPDGTEMPPGEFPSKRALDEEQVIRDVELGVVKEDGSVIWTKVSAAPLPFDDWRLIVATVDVTEQVEAREALRRQNEELQALTRELDAFAYSVAHDLKQPLMAILGGADLLAERLAPALDTLPFHNATKETLQKLLEMIIQGVIRMRDIIDSLLLLSRSRSEEVQPMPVDMGAIVAEATQNLEAMIEEFGVELIKPTSWPKVLAYEPWLESVWANYLSNAIKYGGRPPRVELGAEKAGGGMVRFWVRDNGAGLTREEQAQLFTPFTRLHDNRKPGHGLGLTIVRRIVTRLGGQVGVDSQAGEGSTFWFSLPAASTNPNLLEE
ncbi:MAG TPA: ATP-binding protein, partial [Anaerolineae bacterium]|nr:ATP-binding protein [Anaerolineae bacterium]